jgi:hypothetical protein
MEKHSHLPDPNQLSMLTGVILLAYAIAQYMTIPVNPVTIQLPGLYIPINFQFKQLVSLTVAILAAAGMDWIISTHPHNPGKDRLQHWLLPALTAWTIGIPLNSIEKGPTWWGVFLFGGSLLVLVILAEYISVDSTDSRSTIVSIGISALSLGLFLILAISVRASGARLYLVLPAIGIGSALVSLRVFYLRSGYKWQYAWSTGISLLLVQVAAGLHYLPLSPVQFGLLQVGLLYDLITISGDVIENRLTRSTFIEPGIVMGAVIILVLILR